MQKPDTRNRTAILWILTFVYMFNFIDRQIISSLSDLIQKDLSLTDFQMGLLKGFAFALLYTLVGIPIAWLADRFNRKKIIATSLAAWSGFTAVTGMTHSWAAILAARVGVGIGEAGGSPPSHSIISDLYPKEKRSSALGIYSLGIPFGIAFSYILAGMLVAEFGWRGTLKILGGSGILLAFVVFAVVREPKRGQMEGKTTELPPVTLKESIQTLGKIPSWWAMCLGIAFVSYGGYSSSQWGVDYIVRFAPEYAGDAEDPSKFRWLMLTLGLVHLIGYGFGTYYGALLTEKLAKKNVSAYGWVPAVALVIGAPALIASYWVDSVGLHIALVTVYLVAAGVYLGPSFAVAQTLAPINMRAMSTALFFFILNLIALGGGPTITGFISGMLEDQYGNVMSLRIALTTLIIPFIISIIAFFWAAKTLPKDWAEAERRNEVDLAD